MFNDGRLNESIQLPIGRELDELLQRWIKDLKYKVTHLVVGCEAPEIEGFDQDIAEELRARAKDALLTQAIASEEKLEGSEPAEDLLNMEGMDRHLAFVLANKGIVTMEDLAEQAIEDLIDIEELDSERAGKLIMTARAPWFAEEEAQ